MLIYIGTFTAHFSASIILVVKCVKSLHQVFRPARPTELVNRRKSLDKLTMRRCNGSQKVSPTFNLTNIKQTGQDALYIDSSRNYQNGHYI